jgi:membrane carboxypeptidase/penicillin-binding protein
MQASAFFAILAVAIVLFFIIVLILQWLWNMTMPDVFNLKQITFWQAMRILIISAILFGGGGSFLQFNKPNTFHSFIETTDLGVC